MITLRQADELAVLAHGATRMRSGSLFIDHVRRVAAPFIDDDEQSAAVAALLHDTVEKGTLTFDDLRAAGVDDELIDIVDALTERVGEPDAQYLQRCAAHPVALRIKRVDVNDKLHPAAISLLDERDRRVVETAARDRLARLERIVRDR